MKIKVIALFLFAFVTSIFIEELKAQISTHSTEKDYINLNKNQSNPEYEENLKFNKWRHNWYISLGAGAQKLLAEDDDKASLSSGITFAPVITVGRNISPIFGLRADLTGGSLHGYNDGISGIYRRWIEDNGAYQGAGFAGRPGYPSTTGPEFLTWDPTWTAKGWTLGNEIHGGTEGYYWVPGTRGELYMQHMRYMAVNLSATVDVTNLFRAYQPDRFFTLSVFGGPSAFYVFSHEGSKYNANIGFNAGFNAKARISDLFDVFAEGRGMLYPDDFDGHMGGTSGDLVLQMTAGLSMKFGNKNWTRCAPVDYDEINRLNDEINRLRALPCGPLIEPIRPSFNLFSSFIQPEIEHIKQRNLSGEAYILFKVNKTDLDQSIGDNIHELGKISKSINYVAEEEGVVINKIHISGYASPEGNEQANFKLSQGRAAVVADNIRMIHKLSSELFTVTSNGENWDGLLAALDNTSLTDLEKAEVSDIIRNSPTVTARKNKLRTYKGGQVYNYLLQTVYPTLRRTNYKIDFTVPQFSIEKGKELLYSKPNMLSLYEMSEIAKSYEKGSIEYVKAIETAAAIYPNDPIAIINASSVALDRGELERASSYLEQVKKDPRAFNNLAVLYMLQGKTNEAATYFNLAVENGDPKAQDNIEKAKTIQEALENYELEMKEYKIALDAAKAAQESR